MERYLVELTGNQLDRLNGMVSKPGEIDAHMPKS